MSPWLVILLILAYFGLLLLIAQKTSDNSNDGFFTGRRNSPWYVVAFGMIGASLSGVTFISVPGWVGAQEFAYMQVVLGYVVGYIVIATVLLPLYYRLHLTSIYEYLKQRFGTYSYRSGAWLFLVSRIIGASFRLYLVAMVLKIAVFDRLDLQVPYILIAGITILLIWVYTSKGGIKTIVWTDTLQTAFMLLAVVVTLYAVSETLTGSGWSWPRLVEQSEYSKIFNFSDWNAPHYFWKDFISGAFIAIVMTGLDQDMMQKNLSCKNVKEARKNVLWLSVSLVMVNLLFLSLGAMLFIYSGSKGIPIPDKADELFPSLAMNEHFGMMVSLFFILGMIAAAYSSADSALTALTTSFSVDILEVQKLSPKKAERIRKRVHIAFSVVLLLAITIFREVNNDSVIAELFKAAGYTYGPLLGMFAFGLFTNFKIWDKGVVILVILSPFLTYFFMLNAENWFNGYKPGFELLILNGLLTFMGMYVLKVLKTNK
ncbi:MAG TPA: sodium:solute symporter [Flavobacteriales bacterium]|jgi:SSS family solute:Na+ symporter|nr:sodium:solute symporter [Flavobacteriales bacterium]